MTAEAIEAMTLLARCARQRAALPGAGGGGAELAMACDLRLAAAHVRIAFLQGRLAISTARGGGMDLMRLVGTAPGLELLASSRMVPAAEAAGLGLVGVVAPAARAIAGMGSASRSTG